MRGNDSGTQAGDLGGGVSIGDWSLDGDTADSWDWGLEGIGGGRIDRDDNGWGLSGARSVSCRRMLVPFGILSRTDENLRVTVSTLPGVVDGEAGTSPPGVVDSPPQPVVTVTVTVSIEQSCQP